MSVSAVENRGASNGRNPSAGGDLMEQFVAYVANARTAALPHEVVEKSKQHILDTFAAMISGSRLKPGQMALKYARLCSGGPAEALVVGSALVLPAVNTALANGMLAHADETDDSGGGIHPGCVVLPAALAMAEREDASGAELIRAVALGYDVGDRISDVLGRRAVRLRNHLSMGICGTMAASAAAGCLAGLTDPEQFRYLFSYGAQQASGIATYPRDTEHVEKAFIFAGMGARNGVTAATMVQAGFSGVRDVFTGEGNFFSAYCDHPKPEKLVDDLGKRYAMMTASIKKYSVGHPIQAPLDALLALMREHGLRAEHVERVSVRLPHLGARTVNDREMPDINLQYMCAVALLDGDASFEAAHDVARMTEARVLDLRSRITVIGDEEMTRKGPYYQAVVEVTLKTGKSVREHAVGYRGTPENPLSLEEVETKARALMAPVLGRGQSHELIEMVRRLETLPSCRELRPLLKVALS